jgi:hypothetical protein
MRSLHILDVVKRVSEDVDHYNDPVHGAFDDIDEELFPTHTRLG